MRTTIDSYKARAGRLDPRASTSTPSAAAALATTACGACATCTTSSTTPSATCATSCSRRPTATPTSPPSSPAGSSRSSGTARPSAAVLEAHGEAAGAPAGGRPAPAAQVAGRRRSRRPPRRLALAGHTFVAVHMAWGAVNEWTTQAGYAAWPALEGHPVLSDLLRRIMKPGGPAHRLLRRRGHTPAGRQPRVPGGSPAAPCATSGARSAPA